MDRKDLLMQEEIPLKPEVQMSESKLAELADEAAILIQMTDTRGWKLLYSKFIEPRSSKDRLLTVRSGPERDEVWGAVGELTNLMKWIEGRINQGQKAMDQLETLRKQRR